MKEKYEFCESAARAGYPYAMTVTAELEGRIDAVIYSSYKTLKDAYYDAAHRLHMIAEVFEDADELVIYNASITRTEIISGRYPHFKHQCIVSRYGSGNYYCIGGLQSHQTIVRPKKRKSWWLV